MNWSKNEPSQRKTGASAREIVSYCVTLLLILLLVAICAAGVYIHFINR